MSRRTSRGQKNAIYLRRAPFLVSYWWNGELIFENYLTRKKVTASPETAAFLHFFSDWTRLEEVLRHWPEYSSHSLLRAVSRLVRETLLEASGQKKPLDDEKQRALRRWRAWNPAAGFYHLSTKDIYAEEFPTRRYPRCSTCPLEYKRGSRFPTLDVSRRRPRHREERCTRRKPTL
jgi:hypothetical protein